MLLSTKDGIACDLCGAESRRQFTYYSLEAAKVVVDAEQQRVSKTPDIDRRYLNLDVCERCWEELCAKVLRVVRNKEGRH